MQKNKNSHTTLIGVLILIVIFVIIFEFISFAVSLKDGPGPKTINQY